MDFLGFFNSLDDKMADDAEQKQLRLLSRQLDALLRHAGVAVEEEANYPTFSPAVRTEIEEGRKIPAIKLYREETGLGLKEAKEMIDGNPLPRKHVTLTEITRKVDRLMEQNDVVLGENSTCNVAESSVDFLAEVEQHVRRGNKIQAIATYRQAKMVGLKEAKDAVDAIERRLLHR